jgi:glycerophosphoryl diester phosphodiesterase
VRVHKTLLHFIVFSLFVSSCGLLSLSNSTSTYARPLSTCSSGLLVAHRGYEPGRVTENTIPAFTRAINAGVRTVETDIQRTKDGHWILMHDAKINRTTRGKGFVSRLNLAQIKRVKTNDGVRGGIPTMQQALSYLGARSSLKMQLEIKPAITNRVVLKKIVDFINYYKVHSRITVISFNKSTLRAIRTVDPSLSTGLITQGAVSPSTAKNYGNSVIMNQSGVSTSLVNKMHANGIRVFAWTVNNRAGWARMVSAGADGVTTDKPPALNKFCRAARR